MTSDNRDVDAEQFAQLLEDYYAECDEHLSIVRRCLLAIEGDVGEQGGPGAILDELFRSFHTVKGISGMVGFAAVETLAHATESFLRAVRRGDTRLTLEGVEGLFESAATVGALIAAKQSGGDPPDPTAAISRLETLAGAADTGPASGDDSALRGAAPARSAARSRRFEFTPSAELSARGVNVDSVRGRLQAIGQMVHASPVVRAQGAIAFEFVVVTDADDSVFASWPDDGIVLAPPDDDPVPAEPEADALAAPARTAVATLLAPSNVVRVDLARLDELMRVIGELVVNRTRLAEQIRRLEPVLSAADWRPLSETSAAMERALRDLREGVMHVRMVPIGEVFDRMQFVARDLAREYRKRVRLEVNGRETEIDKYLVERMMDPLLHLVRNAVSHGLEAPDEREAAGKPAEGRITLTAATAGEDVVIDVEDDGRGIDLELVTTRARAAGLVAAGAAIDAAMLLDVLSAPGFSTRDEADRGSGRGVGMDVVQRAVRELGGTISAETAKGRGAHFSIRLPLTLAIADALIVAVGGERFAVPQSSVLEVLEVDPASIRTFENNEVVQHRGSALPILRLARLFSLEECPGRALHTFVVGKGSSAVGIAVDRILGLREIVVRTVRDPMVRVPGVAGVTELGDGRAILILDVAALTKRGAATRAHGGSRPQ